MEITIVRDNQKEKEQELQNLRDKSVHQKIKLTLRKRNIN